MRIVGELLVGHRKLDGPGSLGDRRIGIQQPGEERPALRLGRSQVAGRDVLIPE